MAPFALAAYGIGAAALAYVTRLIGPKVRSGDQVLVNAMTLPPGGIPAALAMFPLFQMKVIAVTGDTFSAWATGGAAAQQADGSVVVSPFNPPAGPFNGIPIANIVNAKVSS